MVMADLSRDEFEQWMNLLLGEVKGTNERLDMLNGRTRKNEQDIAILYDRSLQSSKDPTARWTGLSGIIAGVLTFVYQLFHK